MARFAAGDSDRLAALYTEDAKFKAPHQEALSGRAAIGAFFKAIHKSGITAVGLQTYGLEADATSAIEFGRYELKTSGGAVADAGDFLVHWKKQDGAWKLHRDSISTNAPAPKA